MTTRSERLGEQPNTTGAPENEPVAIIGIGCRLPGDATTPDSFWGVMASATCAITDTPATRWGISRFYDPNPAKPGKTRACRGGYLTQIDGFDPIFFGISPREAESLDPQQRVLLEVAWEALEDAGLAVTELAGSDTSVYIGGFTHDYMLLQFSGSSRDRLGAHTATGVVMTMLSNRLSYTFDLHGPSVTVDTACSSSLVAVDLACRSLWSGTSKLAIAGGCNIMIGPDFTIAESKGGFLSPTGQSRAFDAAANGYVRAEGAGIVVLKPLAQALADRDRVYAVIRGTAVNQDGRTNGITVPSGDAQRAVIRAALGYAGLAPGDIDYVEAHGTGTPVGDPIEAGALGAIYGLAHPADRPCIIGSVKTNLGHLEAGAGIAGLIKTALGLAHRQIPAHLNLENPNPQIPFDELHLRVPRELTPWPDTGRPARAAVNSFGFGGTNAHVVLEEAPRDQDTGLEDRDGRYHLLPVSARSSQALTALCEHYQAFLLGAPDRVPLSRICAAAIRRRSHHAHRAAVVGRSAAEMAEHLGVLLHDPETAERAAGKPPRIGFVFSGMGTQWWAMARQLLATEPVFRSAVERTDAALRPLTGWSLLAQLQADEASSQMGETAIAQPANFAVQVGLAELWRSWGITPDAIVGHSAGEVAAAYVAGALDWDDAIKVVFHRSRLQQRTTGQGRIMAVGLSHDAARALPAVRDGRLAIAACNSPSSVALVGELAELEVVSAELQNHSVFCRVLHGKVPYHSRFMDPLEGEMRSALAGLAPRAASVPIYSTVTGELARSAVHDSEYWWRNVRNPVLFADAIRRMSEDGFACFLEVSPHPVLSGSVEECLTTLDREPVVLPSLHRGDDDRKTLLGSLGALYTLGFDVAWAALEPGPVPHVDLPGYPWQRDSYWSESDAARGERLNVVDHPLLGRRMPHPRPAWQLSLNKQDLPYLADHRVMGTAIFPGAGYAEMALAATVAEFGEGNYALEDMRFHNALFVSDDYDPTVLTTLDPRSGVVEILSRKNEPQDNAWVVHATVRVRHI